MRFSEAQRNALYQEVKMSYYGGLAMAIFFAFVINLSANQYDGSASSSATCAPFDAAESIMRNFFGVLIFSALLLVLNASFHFSRAVPHQSRERFWLMRRVAVPSIIPLFSMIMVGMLDNVVIGKSPIKDCNMERAFPVLVCLAINCLTAWSIGSNLRPWIDSLRGPILPVVGVAIENRGVARINEERPNQILLQVELQRVVAEEEVDRWRFLPSGGENLPTHLGA